MERLRYVCKLKQLAVTRMCLLKTKQALLRKRVAMEEEVTLDLVHLKSQGESKETSADGKGYLFSADVEKDKEERQRPLQLHPGTRLLPASFAFCVQEFVLHKRAAPQTPKLSPDVAGTTKGLRQPQQNFPTAC